MNVNGYGCEQRKSYCMLRPMVAEYELFVFGVVWSSKNLVRVGDFGGLQGHLHRLFHKKWQK